MTVQNTDRDQANLSDGTLFFWGEYESIDWEQVHAGEASILYTSLPATSLLLVHLVSQQSVDFAKGVQFRPSACLLLLLPQGLDQESTPLPQHQEMGS